jgi:phosphoglucosamine mutase
VLRNARVTDRDEAMQNVVFQNAIEEVTAALGDTGRLLVRKSGTEPLLRVMVEAPTEELCQEHVNRMLDALKEQNLLIGVK